MSLLKKNKIPYLDARTYRDVLKNSRSSFFSAFWFLNREKREALNRIYSFARVADDCVDDLQDSLAKRQALDFWTAQIRKIDCHDSDLHPMIADLRTTVERFSIPKEYFLGLLEGCAMDVDKRRYADFGELHEYCYRVAGLVGLMCLKVFEYDSPTAKDFAVNLGLALQLTNILRDVKEDLKLGRIYFPQDELRGFDVSEDQLQSGQVDGDVNRYFEFFWERAESFYQMACQEFVKDRSGKLRAARVMMLSYHAIFQKIRTKNFPVLKNRVSLNWVEKLLLLAGAIKSS